jgi:protoheme IX farnesyltransferase
LTKPEVNLLVLMATSAGYCLGSGKSISISGLLNTLIGTLLVASGTATLNQWMERRWDAKMRRTASRPLPSGRLSAREALLFGVLLSIGGSLYLVLVVNRLSSLVAITALASYLLVYTPLKRKTALCTLLGAVPGAMPTLIGWTGAGAAVTPNAWLLFTTLFLWQFPHFLAIALTYREDYARAGYKMLPDFDASSRFTKAEILCFTIVLVCTTMLPLTGSPSFVYSVGMFLAGAFLLHPVIQLLNTTSKRATSRLILASVLYLPVVLAMMVAAKFVRV